MRRIFTSCLIGNAVLSALPMSAVATSPIHLARYEIGQAVNAGIAATETIAAAYQATGIMPNDNTTAGIDSRAAPVANVLVDATGAVLLKFRKDSTQAGKTIELKPRLVDGQIANWTCSSDDVSASLLPERCR